MSLTALPPEKIPALMNGLIRPNSAHAGRADAYLPSPCIQNHAANLAFLPGGTLSCVWFGGTMEGMGDIAVYMSKLAPGTAQWSEPQKLSDDPSKSEQNPLIFNAPDRTVWLLYTSQTSGDQDGAVVKCRISRDDGKTFGPVRLLCDLPGTFVRQPIVTNSKGDWLLPAFRCVSLPGQRWSGDVDTAGVLISRDQGQSWTMTDVPDSLGAVHMNILALGKGRMIAFFRNRFALNVLSAASEDDGESWSRPRPINLPNNNSSIQAVLLKDDRIAMVYNHSSAETSTARRRSLYDEIESDQSEMGATEPVTSGRKAIWGVSRAPLSLALSDNGGADFHRLIDLDTGDGYCLSNNSRDSLNREFSYPSIVEGPDGTLHIAYTYYRRAIKYVRLPAEALG
ncbi:neuraminidase protein (plasmid) [Rhizobium etli 8C-3]|uniref:Neuraminidase protein n=2 Tax=Rhizobium TaxID=379 RepID=A0A1L5PEB3_RHIET|nr:MULTISPECIES: exo-alpha-sialidase [Rhizobium]APO78504.1 neuraminidase protein [Rhizobium etli 8C-3]TCU24704.1 putative neuraminidase [Rhizobium azibense]TCU39450.1 putative neuraminidase [Rhizobium azibense]